MRRNSSSSSTDAMDRRNSVSGNLLILIFAVLLVGETLSDTEIKHALRTEDSEGSGDAEITVSRSEILLTENEAEENREGDLLPRNETEVTDTEVKEDRPQTQEDPSASVTQETPLPEVAVAEEMEHLSRETNDGQEKKNNGEDGESSSNVSASAAPETVTESGKSDADELIKPDPSEQVIIWDGNMDVGTVDPEQALPGVNEPKQPPSQERHTDVDSEGDETSKEKGRPGEEGHLSGSDRSTGDLPLTGDSSENDDESTNTGNSRSIVDSSSPGVARSSTWLIVLTAVVSSLLLSGMSHLVPAIEQYSRCLKKKECAQRDVNTCALTALSPIGCTKSASEHLALPFHLN